MPLISVIVPVYNAELYLRDCIESIIVQTFSDYEIILVNDGSTDSSGNICEEYAQKDTRIMVYHQENCGQAVARNYAISKAKGKWITFLDSDDLLHPQMLEYLYKSVKMTGAQMAMCKYVENKERPQFFSEDLEFSTTNHFINEDNLLKIVESCFYWTVWAKLIKKEIVQKDMFQAGRIYEDNAVAGKWFISAQMVSEVPLPMYFYRDNDAGTTKSEFSEKKLDWLWALEEQMKYYYRIGYYGMLNHMYHLYYEQVPAYYRRIIRDLHDKNVANNLRKQSVRIYKNYSKIVESGRSAGDILLYITCPRLRRILRKIKGIDN